jgi:Methyltransferase domain
MNKIVDIKSFIVELMGSNPYDGFDTSGYALDITGWHSDHPWFETIITQLKPRLILEVGTWKGASAIHMAELAIKLEPAAQILCIDTWLGSHRALWMNPEFRKDLHLKHGLPQQYFQFLANVILSNLQNTIFPLPMTSYSATDILGDVALKFDLIYIDAHHDEEEVASDIRRCFDLLRTGGIMFGDDYRVGETGVIKAVNRFAGEQGLYLNTDLEKWAIRKPT